MKIVMDTYKLWSFLYKSKKEVCLSVKKDLANRWTGLVLLYSLASHRFYLGEDTTTLRR